MGQIYKGHCTCNHVQFRMLAKPLIVHCCHCTWCQRESGSAFAVNALIENHLLELTHGNVEVIGTPSNSGRGQKIARCPLCRVAVWSHYSHKRVSFVRVGTLECASSFPPDVHIYTSTKQPWVELPAGVPAMKGFYLRDKVWPQESLDRMAELNKTRT